MSAPDVIAPTTNWPSAPMLKILARKHSARPTAHNSSGAILTPTSDQPCRLASGSKKNTARPSRGDLPTARNMNTPHSAVRATAIKGDSQTIRREGSARGTSSSMGDLCGGVSGDWLPGLGAGPQAAHPLADLFARGLGAGDGRRQAALGQHDQPVGQLEQFVEFLGNQQNGAARIAQRERRVGKECRSRWGGYEE